ncbi:MAG: PQQ-binding-like beta-propeller repeat protein [Pseudomonadota bacterium]
MLKKNLLRACLALSFCYLLISCSGDDDELPQEGRIAVLPKANQLQPDLVGQSPTIPTAVVNSDWGQVGGLPFRDIGNIVGPETLQKKWSVDVGTVSSSTYEAVSQPVISAGQVYVLNADAELYAVNAETGKILWEKALVPESEEDVNPRGGGVAAEGGYIFVTTGMGIIFALNASDGDIVWQIDNRVPFDAAPTLFDGRLYVIDRDNRLQAFDALSGRTLWDYRALPEPAAFPRVASASVVGDVVIAPFTSGELVAIDARTAKAAWQRNIVGASLKERSGKFNTIAAHPVISKRSIFASVPSGLFVALNGANGRVLWEREISAERTPLTAADTVYAIDTDARLIAMRKSDGKIYYITQLPAYEDIEDKEDPITWNAPLMIEGKLLLFSDRGYFAKIDAASGDIITLSEDMPETAVDASISNKMVYVLGKNGRLYAYGMDKRI